MNNTILGIASALIGLILLLLLAVAATWVGGIGIRHDFSASTTVALAVSSPVVRGLPAVIRWDPATVSTVADVVVLWHDAQGEYQVGESMFNSGVVVVVMPCDSAAATGSFVVKERTTQRVVAQTAAELLPAGADCAY